MIDASHHPYEDNIKLTKQVVEYAHAHGVVVEAELGQLGGIEEHVKGVDDVDGAPDRPGPGRGVCQADRLRFAGGGHRHQPRRLQVQDRAEAGLRCH